MKHHSTSRDLKVTTRVPVNRIFEFSLLESERKFHWWNQFFCAFLKPLPDATRKSHCHGFFAEGMGLSSFDLRVWEPKPREPFITMELSEKNSPVGLL